MSLPIKTTLALLLALFSSATHAATGKIGDPAPKFSDMEWVKGDPVKMETGSVYVIEFWATWCGPCIANIPHLTELQHSYKDKKVTIIGVSTEEAEIVKPFVKKRGDQMNYTVALDTTGQMKKVYMKAFDQGGIPHAFIIDQKGLIAWHGHPNGMDRILGQVVAGSFDGVAHEKRINEKKSQAAQDRKEKRLALEQKLAENADDVDTLIEYGILLLRTRANKEKVRGVISKAHRLAPEKCAKVSIPAFKHLIQEIVIDVELAKINLLLENDQENVKLLIKRAETQLGDSFVTKISHSPLRLRDALADYNTVLQLDPEDNNHVTEQIQFFEAWQLMDDTREQAFKEFCKAYPDSIRRPFALFSLYHYADKAGDSTTALNYLKEMQKAEFEEPFEQSIDRLVGQLQKIEDSKASEKAAD